MTHETAALEQRPNVMLILGCRWSRAKRANGPTCERKEKSTQHANNGWGGRIRTYEWRDQNPLPYHLATPQHVNALSLATAPLRARSLSDGNSGLPLAPGNCRTPRPLWPRIVHRNPHRIKPTLSATAHVPVTRSGRGPRTPASYRVPVPRHAPLRSHWRTPRRCRNRFP